MDDLTRLITIALGIITLATAAGLGLQRSTVTSLRERLKDNDDELTRVKGRLTERDAELKVVKTDLAALARVVTGEAHWVALADKLDAHHDEASGHWLKDEQLLGDMETILVEIRDRLPNQGAS